MKTALSALRDSLAISALDAELALTLADLVGERAESTLLAVALASRATREGHVCADLSALAGTVARGADGAELGMTYPSLEEWLQSLTASRLVGNAEETTPLVLDTRGRLYLRRHFRDEQGLAKALSTMAAAPAIPSDPRVTSTLAKKLFPASREVLDRQRLAAEIAAVSRLCVITGGPGTGKTTTVARILALLAADGLARGDARFRALLLAPTGKAAARLADAVAKSAATLECPDEIRERLPTEACTIHRALEQGRTGFRIGPNRPLLADVVIVDEASMVDLSLMRSLVDSVPPSSRLILLGDRHQLSSVEAGAVLADITGSEGEPRYSSSLDARLESVFGERLPRTWIRQDCAPIDDSTVELVDSHRFSISSPLGRLASAIQRGAIDDALACLESGDADVVLLTPGGRARSAALSRVIVEGYRRAAVAADAGAALEALASFRVLCAQRRGTLGVEGLNRFVAQTLAAEGLTSRDRGLVQPFLIGRNDADLDVMNGDVGVIFRESSGESRAFLPGNGSPRALSPARLPAHEPAFAMSIHKSQGSEFETVVVVLPEPGSPLLTRELLYTAVTRAKRRLVLHASRAAVAEAIERRITRASGLAELMRP